MSSHQNRGAAVRRRRAVLGLLLGAALSIPVVTSAQTSTKEERVDVEGSVKDLAADCPKGSFVVGAQTVMIDASTRFEDGACADLADGRKVEVEGTVRGNRIVARVVDLDD
jgi:hypothetical protein